jgi:hypothetical protein
MFPDQEVFRIYFRFLMHHLVSVLLGNIHSFPFKELLLMSAVIIQPANEDIFPLPIKK